MFRYSKKSSPTGLMPMGQIGGPCFPPNVLPMGVPKAHCGTATVIDPTRTWYVKTVFVNKNLLAPEVYS